MKFLPIRWDRMHDEYDGEDEKENILNARNSSDQHPSMNSALTCNWNWLILKAYATIFI